MPELKAKDIRALSQSDTAGLPSFMTDLATTMDTYYIKVSDLCDAPAAWNFYKPLSDNKLMELIVSIEQNGLFHPVVVWKRHETMTILSGHNRVRAFRMLYAQTGNEKYRKIGCVVKKDLTEEQAREIIIDSNWVQRNLSVYERTKSIYEKYVILGRKKREQNPEKHLRTYDIIANDYGLSGRQIYRYIKLASLSEELLVLVDAGTISFNSGIALARFSQEDQVQLVLHCKDQLTNKRIGQLGHCSTFEEAKAVLAEGLVAPQNTSVVVEVPLALKEAFERHVQQWLVEHQ